MAPLRLFDVLASARQRLTAAGIQPAEAAIDVDLYARTILGWDRARLLSEQQREAPAELEPRFSQWLARRERREPTAYIVGHREFWGLDFVVTPAVLIPRPETELIVEEALQALPSGPARVADVGTGSGCVAVALAHERPEWQLVATDISTLALDVARVNTTRHGVADRLQLIATAYLDGVGGTFNLITANPPYVKDRDRPGLAPDVRHEPAVALFGGDHGLRDIGGVLDAAAAKLMRGGFLVMEFGYGQEDDVRALTAQRSGLAVDRVRADLQGIARTAIIRRQ